MKLRNSLGCAYRLFSGIYVKSDIHGQKVNVGKNCLKLISKFAFQFHSVIEDRLMFQGIRSSDTRSFEDL
ncbi:hypothetical protein L6452_20617 [Arctium lappa]|uniref:Uncharacterized protein n=1 Tax=Arctium lappa TaxID=4217 RepID=A0ACB9BCP0_ARCLA|nr:hypothetical protein L6452_20617 [Arctium lappa]